MSAMEHVAGWRIVYVLNVIHQVVFAFKTWMAMWTLELSSGSKALVQTMSPHSSFIWVRLVAHGADQRISFPTTICHWCNLFCRQCRSRRTWDQEAEMKRKRKIYFVTTFYFLLKIHTIIIAIFSAGIKRLILMLCRKEMKWNKNVDHAAPF